MSKQHKPTPGPWKVSRLDPTCVVTSSMTLEELPRSAANARLISAAPEMLEALENALSQFQPKECNCDGEYDDGRLVGHACYFHRIEQDLKDAIAKATGGAE